MRIITPREVAKQAGNKYLGVLVAAKFARYLNEFPKDHLARPTEKLTTKAMQELVESTRANLEGRPFQPKVMPHPYAFNLFSHNTAIDPETGYNEEETKVINETRKIFEDERIAIGITCVRVPVLRAHSQAITFECERPITEDEVREILSTAPGVRIVDHRIQNYFPMPADASGQDDVLVGRIRADLSDPTGHSISMFVAADQLLKGAALNAVQIAELLPERVMA